MSNTTRPLRNTTPQMCAWCSSAATCEVAVPTPELEARAGRQRYAPACDRHAILHATRHHTVADTLAAEDRVRAEDGHIGGRA